jgi:predicted phosphodiesterase
MKIKLVSDLHLEFGDIVIHNDQNCDVLILGGDIMVAQDLHDFPAYSISAIDEHLLGKKQVKVKMYRDFLRRCSEAFPHVIFIAGNHEYYYGKFPDAVDYLREECEVFPNVYFLEMNTKEIEDVTFIGCTLWTDLNKGDPVTLYSVKDMMNDYRVIRNSQNNYAKLSPMDTLVNHRNHLAYIKHVTENDPNKKYVVAGHHSPSKLSTHEKYRGERIMNGCYSSDLSDFILDHPQIKLWTHGHTHYPFDYMLGETRIVCNPRGYEGYEDPSGWNPNIVLEI